MRDRMNAGYYGHSTVQDGHRTGWEQDKKDARQYRLRTGWMKDRMDEGQETGSTKDRMDEGQDG